MTAYFMEYRLRNPIGNGGGPQAFDVAKYIMQRKCSRKTIYKHSIGYNREINNALISAHDISL